MTTCHQCKVLLGYSPAWPSLLWLLPLSCIGFSVLWPSQCVCGTTLWRHILWAHPHWCVIRLKVPFFLAKASFAFGSEMFWLSLTYFLNFKSGKLAFREYAARESWNPFETQFAGIGLCLFEGRYLWGEPCPCFPRANHDLFPNVKVQWVPDTPLHPFFSFGSVILKTRSLNIFFLFQDVKSNNWVDFGLDRLSWRILFHLLFLVNETRIIYHM